MPVDGWRAGSYGGDRIPLPLPHEILSQGRWHTPSVPCGAPLAQVAAVRRVGWDCSKSGEPSVIRPRLLARLLTDGGDTLAVGLAAARGWRNPRFLAL